MNGPCHDELLLLAERWARPDENGSLQTTEATVPLAQAFLRSVRRIADLEAALIVALDEWQAWADEVGGSRSGSHREIAELRKLLSTSTPR